MPRKASAARAPGFQGSSAEARTNGTREGGKLGTTVSGPANLDIRVGLIYLMIIIQGRFPGWHRPHGAPIGRLEPRPARPAAMICLVTK